MTEQNGTKRSKNTERAERERESRETREGKLRERREEENTTVDDDDVRVDRLLILNFPVHFEVGELICPC